MRTIGAQILGGQVRVRWLREALDIYDCSPLPRMPIIRPPNASAFAGSNSISLGAVAVISVVVIDFSVRSMTPIVTLAGAAPHP
jgi:hypothetical protein